MSHLLVFPELACREFGSGLILTESFLRLAAEKGWRLPPECRLEGFDLLHIESALNSLTVAQPAVSREVAVMLLAGSAAAEHELAETLPEWTLQSARGNVWRQRIRDSLAAGELRLADPISFEEVQALPAGAPDAAPAPAPAQAVPDAPVQAAPEHSGPPPLLSREMADAFAGIGARDARRWRKYLGEPPKWLLPARVASGSRGRAGALWNPVALACLQMGEGKGTLEAFSRKFRERPELENWRDAWAGAISWPGLTAG